MSKAPKLPAPNFEESGVREEIITPILKALNYKTLGRNRILREKALKHPVVQIGSKNQKLTSYPDYLLEVNGKYSWVLDAKAPKADIKTGKHVEQAYFYAIHPEIRVNYYGLCNGKEFILFHISDQKPCLYFQIQELENNWTALNQYLSPDALVQTDVLKSPKIKTSTSESAIKPFDYMALKLPEEIKVRKQAAKRHFGVHGYFTRQAWNVVQHYIQHFSQKGDLVLDSFGGSGITLIESLMIQRKAIHIDLNPLSIFLVKNLIEPISFTEIEREFDKIHDNYMKNYPKTEIEIQNALKKYPYPKDIPLTKNTGVETVNQLFSQKQLAQLAFLKHLILKVKDKTIKNSLLIAFSSTLNKINLTYHPSKSRGDNAGNSSIFIYYSHRIAKDSPDLDVFQTFETKYKRMLAAKKEMAVAITEKTIQNAQIYQGDASKLAKIKDQSVDYIYTDPPYGSKIAYLDLSTMWNAWLGFEVSQSDREKEAIEGGSLNKSSDDYGTLLSQSIREMYRVLKFDRWMSFVFAHKDPKYWHLIIESAEKAGFEYAGAVKQSNGQSSFKKRQNPFSVLSGQLIINFRKVKTPQSIQKAKLGAETYHLIIETIESVIAENNGSTLEQINDRLIITGLELGFLDILSKEYKDLTPVLADNFDYNSSLQTYHIKSNKKFKSNIPLDLRIRYFLLSYLRRKERQKVYPTSDAFILDLMPLLKNGITPEDQTILKVLESIAVQTESKTWRLKPEGQGQLFEIK